MSNGLGAVNKIAVIQIARDVLLYHHKLFDKLRKKIDQMPEIKFVYGYDIEELVAFGQACRQAHVTDDDLKAFAHNLEAAVELTQKAQEKMLLEMFEEG